MKKQMIFILTLLLYSGITKADEGMWMLNKLSPQTMKAMKSLGFKLNEKELYNPEGLSLKDAVVSFGGFCSGVVVSSDGLVFTNHHCGYANIQALATPKNDILKNGFVAQTLADEKPAPGLFVSFLQYTVDVTDRVNQALDKLYKEQEAFASKQYGKEWKEQLTNLKIDSICTTIEQEYALNDRTTRAQITPYFTRNAYYLSVYKDYKDIRLVFAPPTSLGKFGGDTDNWMWPRQTADFSVFRIYTDEQNQPAEYSSTNRPFKPEHYARISMEGYQQGDYCMTLGFPGSTNRYLSSYGIQERVNNINASRIQVRGIKQEIWKKWMNTDPAIQLQYAAKYAQSSNYWKNSIGMNKAIKSLKVIQEKQRLEKRIQKWSANAPYTKERFGNIFKELKKAYAGNKEITYAESFFFETFWSGSDLFRIARTYKPLLDNSNATRARQIKSNLAKLYKDYNVEVDKEATAALLKNYANQVKPAYLPTFYYTIEKEYKNNYTAYVEDLYKKTKLASAEAIDLNPTEVMDDVMFLLHKEISDMAAKLSALSLKNKQVINANEKLLCQAILEMEQDQPHYSDANSTLRLSYGFVADYTNEGVRQNYFTTVESLLDKIAQGNENPDYTMETEITQMLKKGDFGLYKDKHTGEMQLCFLTNNDITGGNSGSPMFNAKGELLGLAFDGNWDAMSSDISFTQSLTRCIGVDVRYMLYLMDRWGNAKRILKELQVK